MDHVDFTSLVFRVHKIRERGQSIMLALDLKTPFVGNGAPSRTCCRTSEEGRSSPLNLFLFMAFVFFAHLLF